MYLSSAPTTSETRHVEVINLDCGPLGVEKGISQHFHHGLVRFRGQFRADRKLHMTKRYNTAEEAQEALLLLKAKVMSL